MNMRFSALVIAVFVSACASQAPEQLVNDAAGALGGQDRILAIETLTIEGEGVAGSLG